MHDAGKLIDDLRDHLARHDKRIAFLFGAGTSVSDPSSESNDSEPLIPIVSELTELCKRRVKKAGKSYAEAWERVYLACKEDMVRKKYMDRDPNIEDILSRVHMMVEAVSDFETLANLDKKELTKFESIIRKEIASIANPKKIDSIVEKLPHREFARWLMKVMRKYPVEIFTVNYDVLFEAALEADRVPIFDGFVGSYQPFFHPDSLRHKELAPGDNYTRLWKMHGSVTWRKEEIDARTRIVRGGADNSGEMILPSFQKYDESRQQPYVAFTDRLSRFLELEDALLIVCGFSFGDQHINDIIFQSLENHPRTHVYALQFADHNRDTDLIRRGKQYSNMIIVEPKGGIISGKKAEWGIHSDSSISEAWFERCRSEQTSVDSIPEREMILGKMKIGDFRQFCNFLKSITLE